VRFLADESCDFAVVVALRTAGHDVKAVVEHAPAAANWQQAQSILTALFVKFSIQIDY
jgi:hypothetical protein